MFTTHTKLDGLFSPCWLVWFKRTIQNGSVPLLIYHPWWFNNGIMSLNVQILGEWGFMVDVTRWGKKRGRGVEIPELRCFTKPLDKYPKFLKKQFPRPLSSYPTKITLNSHFFSNIDNNTMTSPPTALRIEQCARPIETSYASTPVVTSTTKTHPPRGDNVGRFY